MGFVNDTIIARVFKNWNVETSGHFHLGNDITVMRCRNNIDVETFRRIMVDLEVQNFQVVDIQHTELGHDYHIQKFEIGVMQNG